MATVDLQTYVTMRDGLSAKVARLEALLREARGWLEQIGCEFEYRPEQVDDLQARIDAALPKNADPT